MRYVIFGAGDYGDRILKLIEPGNVDFYIDNNVQKQREGFKSYKVLGISDAKEKLLDQKIVIATSEEKYEMMGEILRKNGINNFLFFRDIQIEKTREKLIGRTDYIQIYKKAVLWIKNNSIENGGIINNSELRISYPEVTGYYIPTLLKWGYKDLAVSFAKWLCTIQKTDGSWYDTNNARPYVFDSAQILKGLIAIYDIYPDKDQLEECTVKGCKWILSNMTDEGRLEAPDETIWGDCKVMSELIHLYCLSPLVEASKLYSHPEFEEKAIKILEYYVNTCRDDILNFGLLSHFYAYILEGLLDMGERELVSEAMKNIAEIQDEDGAVPAYSDVHWVCSTGLFQLSLVWFRLGEEEKGIRAFNYACKLQNESGGWYGSYLIDNINNESIDYFPNAEISWAVKYFLDALYYKNLLQFERQASFFSDSIRTDDGRYVAIKNCIQKQGSRLKVLDIGCGKGRYLKNLMKELPDNKYYASDLSVNVMSYMGSIGVVGKQGSLTNIPYQNDTFDVVYACEALEHAVDIENAIQEMARVVKSGGIIAIVDKSIARLGYFDIEEWEQWFGINELRNLMLRYCSDVDIIPDLSFDGQEEKGLFVCWNGKVK